MRSLDLPVGSILVFPDQVPDSVYILRMGYMGIFDRMDRLLAYIKRDEIFGLEALFSRKSSVGFRAISNVELDLYEPEEFKEELDLEKKEFVLRNLSRWAYLIKRRYPLSAELRLREIIRDMVDEGVPSEVIRSLPLSLSVGDSIAFERVIEEFQID